MDYYHQAYQWVVDFAQEKKKSCERDNLLLKANLEDPGRNPAFKEDDKQFINWNNKRIAALDLALKRLNG